MLKALRVKKEATFEFFDYVKLKAVKLNFC